MNTTKINISKILKVASITNLIVLGALLLVCFVNSPHSISGVCSECNIETSMMFTFGNFLWLIQTGVAIGMYMTVKKMKKTNDYESVTLYLFPFLLLGSILALLQATVIFSQTPEVRSCEYEFSDFDLLKCDLMAIQFKIGQIVSYLMIIAYCGLLVFAKIFDISRKKGNK